MNHIAANNPLHLPSVHKTTLLTFPSSFESPSSLEGSPSLNTPPEETNKLNPSNNPHFTKISNPIPNINQAPVDEVNKKENRLDKICNEVLDDIMENIKDVMRKKMNSIRKIMRRPS